MNIEKSYIDISPFFDKWARIMEIKTRKMEVRDSRTNDLKILVISPPTDIGIKILTESNLEGESYLLCFSPTIGQIAQKYSNKHNIKNLKICIAHFFSIPFKDEYFDVVFANCFFDFCSESDFNEIIGEISRVLKHTGALFSVYMGFPLSPINKIWCNFIKHFPFFARGCHPVNIKPFLSKRKFQLKKELSLKRFGFPIKYIIAEKIKA